MNIAPKNKMQDQTDIPVRSFLVYCYLCRKQEGLGQYLLLKRAGRYMPGVWQPVTGRVEAGETGWLAALREAKEETGLTPQAFYSTNRVETFYLPDNNCICLAPVFLGFVDPNADVQLSSEHSDFQWAAAETAQKHLAFSQQRETLLYIEQEFIQKKPLDVLQIML